MEISRVRACSGEIVRASIDLPLTGAAAVVFKPQDCLQRRGHPAMSARALAGERSMRTRPQVR
tara:strand:+ start:35298 stop:35486 length:189 start_codon:yes stop_codon:yes gene_type:complete